MEKGTVATSAKVALLVGTILAGINYGDRILFCGDMRAADWVKLAVTYCVPYCVATYGAARYAVRQELFRGHNTYCGTLRSFGGRPPFCGVKTRPTIASKRSFTTPVSYLVLRLGGARNRGLLGLAIGGIRLIELDPGSNGIG